MTRARSARRGRRFQVVQFLGFLGRHQADVDEIERADEPVADAEAAGPRDRVAERYRPVVLEQDQRRGRVGRDVLEHVPALFLGEHVHAALLGRHLGARKRARLHSVLALDAEADQGADLAAHLDGLPLGQVAEVLDRQVALRALVDGERVDHAHCVAGAKPLQLGDDLAVKIGVVEPKHEELHRADCHGVPLSRARLDWSSGAAGTEPARSRPGPLSPARIGRDGGPAHHTAGVVRGRQDWPLLARRATAGGTMTARQVAEQPGGPGPLPAGVSLRTPRAAAVAGIFFSVLLIFMLVVLRTSTPSDPGAAGTWLTDPSRRALVAVALNLVPFAGIAFLWFIGVVRDRIGRHEDRFFATVFLGSGLLFVGMLFVAAAVGGGLIAAAARSACLPGASTLALGRDVMPALLNVYAMRMAAVFTLTTVTIARRTRFVSRWITLAGLATAVVLMVGIGISQWVELLFPGWVLALSIDILVAGPGSAARPITPGG